MPKAADSSLDPFPHVSDRDAIAEVVRGNREMFEVLVRRYNQQLFRVGFACLKRHDAVEDAMQNTYLKAYLHLGKFRGSSAFGTWLTRIMINECRMWLRKHRRDSDQPLSDTVAEGSQPTDEAPEASSNLTATDMKKLLERAIDELPPRYRKVYMLREVQQLSTTETARCLGLSTENVKVTLHRAREQLKAKLLKNAAASELFAFLAPRCNRLTAKVMAAVLAVSRNPA